jgi:hypothetical protein
VMRLSNRNRRTLPLTRSITSTYVSPETVFSTDVPPLQVVVCVDVT